MRKIAGVRRRGAGGAGCETGIVAAASSCNDGRGHAQGCQHAQHTRALRDCPRKETTKIEAKNNFRKFIGLPRSLAIMFDLALMLDSAAFDFAFLAIYVTVGFTNDAVFPRIKRYAYFLAGHVAMLLSFSALLDLRLGKRPFADWRESTESLNYFERATETQFASHSFRSSYRARTSLMLVGICLAPLICCSRQLPAVVVLGACFGNVLLISVSAWAHRVASEQRFGPYPKRLACFLWFVFDMSLGMLVLLSSFPDLPGEFAIQTAKFPAERLLRISRVFQPVLRVLSNPFAATAAAATAVQPASSQLLPWLVHLCFSAYHAILTNFVSSNERRRVLHAVAFCTSHLSQPASVVPSPMWAMLSSFTCHVLAMAWSQWAERDQLRAHATWTAATEKPPKRAASSRQAGESSTNLCSSGSGNSGDGSSSSGSSQGGGDRHREHHDPGVPDAQEQLEGDFSPRLARTESPRPQANLDLSQILALPGVPYVIIVDGRGCVCRMSAAAAAALGGAKGGKQGEAQGRAKHALLKHAVPKHAVPKHAMPGPMFAVGASFVDLLVSRRSRKSMRFALGRTLRGLDDGALVETALLGADGAKHEVALTLAAWTNALGFVVGAVLFGTPSRQLAAATARTKFVMAFELTNDVVRQVSLVDGELRYTYVSPSLVAVLGWQRRAVLGDVGAAKFVGVDELRLEKARVAALILSCAHSNGDTASHTPRAIEYPLLHKDGTEVWFSHKFVRHPYDKESALIVSHELTERRQKQRLELLQQLKTANSGEMGDIDLLREVKRVLLKRMDQRSVGRLSPSSDAFKFDEVAHAALLQDARENRRANVRWETAVRSTPLPEESATARASSSSSAHSFSSSVGNNGNIPPSALSNVLGNNGPQHSSSSFVGSTGHYGHGSSVNIGAGGNVAGDGGGGGGGGGDSPTLPLSRSADTPSRLRRLFEPLTRSVLPLTTPTNTPAHQRFVPAADSLPPPSPTSSPPPSPPSLSSLRPRCVSSLFEGLFVLDGVDDD